MTAVIVIGRMTIAADSATTQQKYGPGVTDTEIKIGNTTPYSAPASALGTVGSIRLLTSP
jgi:branched-chain amino acid transport system substrate-binding protein